MSAVSLSPSRQSRLLQPLDFSERWSLCHHLACVVNHVARAGTQELISDPGRLAELKKAEWFLVREITNKRPCVFSTAPNTQDHPLPLTVRRATQAWGLSPHLNRVIFYITTYQKLLYRFPSTRIICLKQALRHLREEIQSHQPPKTSAKTPNPNRGTHSHG